MRILSLSVSRWLVSKWRNNDADPFIVKYIPSWLPGAGFKRKAKEYATVLRDLVEIPHSYAKSQLVSYLVSHVRVR